MLLNRVEAALTMVVATVAPWLAPIPTAWLVGSATIRHLGWPVWVAVVAAAIVECLGLAGGNVALMLWTYNRQRRKTDPVAPVAVAVTLVGLYVVIAITLTVALDILPGLTRFAPAIFPLFSLTGLTTLALRADHRLRLEAIAADRAERSAARAAARSVTGQVSEQSDRLVRVVDRSRGGSATGQSDRLAGAADRSDGGPVDRSADEGVTGLDRVNAARRLSGAEAQAALIEYLRGHPQASYREAGEAADRSKPWAIEVCRGLVEAGRLHRNGEGWEVRG